MLDREAYARGTTVYLQDRRLDMLPALLSEQLCSLRSGADRLAVSVLWMLGSDLNVQEVWCGPSIIRWAPLTGISWGLPQLGLLQPAVPTHGSAAQIHHVVSAQSRSEGTAAPPMPCKSAAAGRATS